MAKCIVSTALPCRITVREKIVCGRFSVGRIKALASSVRHAFYSLFFFFFFSHQVFNELSL